MKNIEQRIKINKRNKFYSNTKKKEARFTETVIVASVYIIYSSTVDGQYYKLHNNSCLLLKVKKVKWYIHSIKREQDIHTYSSKREIMSGHRINKEEGQSTS